MKYINYYVDWKLIKDNKSQVDNAKVLRECLKYAEDLFPAEKLIVLRQFASKLISQR